ncbi:hypothetical protein ACTJI2_13645 [Pseudoxanthomonas sp. 22568]|uniref:hypothetical protein n=1 Tax=Pseudoxanthomonas sp. 22568 TaxID=3453945 RepID=UPI003F862597
MQSRGIRNNNPGNIDRNPANKWQGRMPREKMTPKQREEPRFEVFASAAWGIRALCVTLITYFDKHGLNTVRKVISRWAPPGENNTSAYVNAVADAIGVKPDDFINLHEYRRLRPLVVSIIQHENGQQPYSADTIDEGLRLAGVVKPGQKLVPAPTAASRATVTALTAGAAAAVVELPQVLPPIVEGFQQALPALQSIGQITAITGSLPPGVRAAAGVLVLLSVGASLYAWWRLRRADKAAQA